MNKLIAIILAGMMLVILIGCGEQGTGSSDLSTTVSQTEEAEKVPMATKFNAKLLECKITVDGNVYYFDGEENQPINMQIKLDKPEELEGTEKNFALNGTDHVLPFFGISTLTNGDKIFEYHKIGLSANYNESGELIGFSTSEYSFEYKYPAKTKEQREELARQAVSEFLSFDASEFVYDETYIESFDEYNGTLKYLVNGKPIDKHLKVSFDKDGKLRGCTIIGASNMDGYDKYPDFNRDEALKLAEQKTIEKLKGQNRTSGYTLEDRYESYTVIGGKYYYTFRFMFDDTANSGHILTTYDYADVYIELITE